MQAVCLPLTPALAVLQKPLLVPFGGEFYCNS